jgi:signal transduction histidine kinase
MKIRNRLPLIFTLSTAFVLVGLSLFVYFFSASFRQNEFFRRLNDRVDITEKLYLEEENLSREVYLEIREKFLHTLPKEVEDLYRLGPGLKDELLEKYPEPFIEELLLKQYSQFEEEERQGVGRLYHSTKGDYVVIVTAIDASGIRKLINLRGILLVGSLLSLSLLFLISWLEARQLLKPISDQIAKARQIGASNLHLRLDLVHGKDEMAEMALTFNRMLDRLESAFEIQKNFISNASHEIKNPLTAIIGEAEISLEKSRSNEEYEQSLKTISLEADRLNTLVTNLLSLAKAGLDSSQITRHGFRLDELLLDIAGKLDWRLPGHQVRVDFSQAPSEPEQLDMDGNANLLGIALTNLIENACKFSENAEVQLCLMEKGGKVQVVIRDQGIGIPKTDLERIKQPFYRSENARAFKGFGIGLSLTEKIIRLHGGSLDFLSEEGKGTEARISF